MKGIADGSLDADKFRFYLIQDYLYLFDYARVFAIGVVKARDAQAMRAFAGYVHEILDGEMEIHRAYMKRCGISRDKAEHTPPALANLSYTSYMRAVAAEEGAAEITAAILSCALSYEKIAQHIVQKNPDAIHHPFYGQWVQGYTSASYVGGNVTLVALMERLATGYSEQQIQHLIDIFIACSRYEAMFWDMAWNGER